MPQRLHLRAAVVVLLSVAPLSSAHAQAPSQEALAEQLFREGRKLMTDGKFDEACPKLAESQRLDPGGGTQLALASCYEQGNRLASAWSAFSAAAGQAKRDGRADRESAARARSEALFPRLSHVIIDVPAEARALDGLEIRLDGALLGAAVWGVAVPVDGGRHVVEAKATGREPFRQAVDVGPEKDSKSVRVPVLTEAPKVAPTPTPSAVAPPPVASTSTPPPSPPPKSDTRTIAYVVGGVGVVALGVGTFFGLSALSKQRDANNTCPTAACTDSSAVAEQSTARSQAWVSDISVGVGLVGISVATYLLLSGGSTPSTGGVVPSVGPSSGSVAWRGSF